MISLRIGKEEDLSIVREIGTTTYGPTYTHLLGQEQVDYMLSKFYTPAALLSQFIDGHTFLIAGDGTRDMAFASYSITDHENRIVKLHKLYVLPSAHGKGLGKFLINEVANKAREEGGKALQLNVNRYNKAKDFYEKAGFTIKETVDIEIGNGFFMNDYVMELPL
ncbi:N-acetyltransferase family protein [Pedobacter sp. AW31-3R]|uniref:GNAT family N-acetyltransferase n=1 Tax=Pedobacter sp. AW31-3R TaxID=3445781 RepID=UPI003FA0B848